MKIIGIIPARGGSKGIPNKNIKKLYKKPLIAWSIESALKSNLDRVIVTTDSPQIAKIAKRYGAEVPLLRPKELAGDFGGIEPVLKHTVEWLEKNEKYKPDAIALLLPTSPLRQPKHINKAIKIFKKKKPDSVISVFEAIANNNPHWILKKNKKGEVVLATEEPLTEIKDRRQELPPYFIRNDLIYLLKPKNLFEKKPNLYGKKVELLEIDNFFDIDINTEEDWRLCLFKFKELKKRA